MLACAAGESASLSRLWVLASFECGVDVRCEGEGEGEERLHILGSAVCVLEMSREPTRSTRAVADRSAACGTTLFETYTASFLQSCSFTTRLYPCECIGVVGALLCQIGLGGFAPCRIAERDLAEQ